MYFSTAAARSSLLSFWLFIISVRPFVKAGDVVKACQMWADVA
jgi:hypothetical protein